MTRVTEPTYPAFEASLRVGLPYALLDAYARGDRPVVPPLNTRATRGPGRGTPREYSFRGLVALRVADELRRIGVRTAVIRALATFIENEDLGVNSPDEARTARPAPIAVGVKAGKVGKPFALRTRIERTIVESGPALIIVDVVALARTIRGGRINRTSAARARKKRRG